MGAPQRIPYNICSNRDEVRRLTGQPKLTAIVQSRRLTIFGSTERMDDDSDGKRILSALPPEDWRRPRERPRITWLSTVQQDLRSHNLTLPEAMDMAKNRSLWRMWSTYGATQSRVVCQKRRRRRSHTAKLMLGSSKVYVYKARHCCALCSTLNDGIQGLSTRRLV